MAMKEIKGEGRRMMSDDYAASDVFGVAANGGGARQAVMPRLLQILVISRELWRKAIIFI